MESPLSSPLSIGPHSRSPSPRRDANPSSLATRLSPWLEFFTSKVVKWDRLPSHGGRLGVALTLGVDMTLSILDEDDEFEHLLQLREAIDLVQLVLAVDPAAIEAFLCRTSRDGWVDQSAVDEDAIASLVYHGARYEVRLSFEFVSIRTRLLQPQLAVHFIHRLGQRLSTNADFRNLRGDLIGRQDESPARLNQSPIPITVEIDSGELEDFSFLDADDFFVYLTAFSETVVTNQRQSAASQWELEKTHAPLFVTRVNLSLRRFCITHRVVLAAKNFMDAGIPVECQRLNLDPRLISCADQKIEEFITTLCQGSTSLRIETGACHDEELLGDIDDEGQDRRENIRAIMNAIAQVETAIELDFFGIFTLCASTVNRQEVIRCLFRHILARDYHDSKIIMDYGTILTANDAECFRDEAALWRQTHPDKKLVAKGLVLHFSNTELDTVAAVVNSFDDAEEVNLSFRHGGASLQDSVVRKVMTFPSLKTLRIENVNIHSMDVFDPSIEDSHVKPVLESLELCDMHLSDRKSLIRFLQKLHGVHGLATTLRRLRFKQSDEDFTHETYRADTATLQALVEMLKTNRVLRDVSMDAAVESSSMKQWSVQFDQFDRKHLPSDLTLRRSAILKSRNVAFLSVMRGTEENRSSAKSLLDSVLINRILDFSSPHVQRKVSVTLWADE